MGSVVYCSPTLPAGIEGNAAADAAVEWLRLRFLPAVDAVRTAEAQHRVQQRINLLSATQGRVPRLIVQTAIAMRHGDIDVIQAAGDLIAAHPDHPSVAAFDFAAAAVSYGQCGVGARHWANSAANRGDIVFGVKPITHTVGCTKSELRTARAAYDTVVGLEHLVFGA